MVMRIPDGGLRLESSAEATAALPLQSFAITLDDGLIESMIECVQNGRDLQLSLGNNPVSAASLLVLLGGGGGECPLLLSLEHTIETPWAQ
jgi:hypothetical protein